MLNMTQIYRKTMTQSHEWDSNLFRESIIGYIDDFLSYLLFNDVFYRDFHTAPWQIEPFCESKAAHPTGPHQIKCFQ